jgi:hypothetical protein
MEASRNLESIHESPLPCALASREVAFNGLTIMLDLTVPPTLLATADEVIE